MDYQDLFRPVFSLATHISPAAARGEGAAFSPGQIAQSVLLALDSTCAGRTTSNAGDFDMAFAAARAWLEETLGIDLGDESFALQPQRILRRLSRGGAPGKEFFANLDLLIREIDAGGEDADRVSLLRLHNDCLKLGFRGSPADPAAEQPAADARKRCRAALAKAEKRENARRRTIEPAAPARCKRRHIWRGALFWAAPIGAAIALFTVYRFILAGIGAGL